MRAAGSRSAAARSSASPSPRTGRRSRALAGRPARIIDAATGAPLRTFRAGEEHVDTVAFSPDGLHLATGADESRARLWRTDTGRLELVLPTRGQYVRVIAFSPTGGAWRSAA